MNSRWIKDLNIRCETIKFLGKNTAVHSSDTGLSNILLGYVSGTRNKSNNIQMILYPTKKLLYSERNYQQNKKATSTGGRRYLQTMYLIRGHYPKYTKNSYNSTPKNNPIRKVADRHFSKWMVFWC